MKHHHSFGGGAPATQWNTTIHLVEWHPRHWNMHQHSFGGGAPATLKHAPAFIWWSGTRDTMKHHHSFGGGAPATLKHAPAFIWWRGTRDTMKHHHSFGGVASATLKHAPAFIWWSGPSYSNMKLQLASDSPYSVFAALNRLFDRGNKATCNRCILKCVLRNVEIFYYSTIHLLPT